MRTTLRVGSALAAFLLCPQFAAHLSAQTTSQLDAYWAEVSRTVEEGDFQGYAALYHEDAVLVSNLSGSSHPIATALDEWEQGFTDTREGRATAGVDFRFSQRLNNGTTAHETGIFNYQLETSTGDVTDQYIHFSALLVKKDGWKMVMEYQQSVATVEEWNALR
jgi:ketosteroid isomerase-like protein